MTHDDIIRMAREAHLDVYGLGKDRKKFVSVVERFAGLVAAAEREECAKLCSQLERAEHYSKEAELWWSIGASECAAAIRARGQS